MKRFQLAALAVAAAVAAGAVDADGDTNLLDAGILLYGFNTNTLDGWTGTKRGALAMDETTKVEGTASMRVDVTNAIGNWANPANHGSLLADAPWTLNSNMVAWIRASGTDWNVYLRVYAATALTYELNAGGGDGHVALDDAWQPYLFSYDPAWLSNATVLTLSYQVTTDGSPAGRHFYVDNMRLLPGTMPEPAAAAVLALGSLIGLRRRR